MVRRLESMRMLSRCNAFKFINAAHCSTRHATLISGKFSISGKSSVSSTRRLDYFYFTQRGLASEAGANQDARSQTEMQTHAPPFPSPENTPFMFDGELEKLTPDQQKQKEELIKDLTRRLSGPLADENGKVPTGKDRPTAIEVDGPSHFYANSTRYTAYTKLKHRLLTRMGYRVLHVPYFEWRKMRGAKEREQYMRAKLEEEPTEWLDPEDQKFYDERMKALQEAAALKQ